MHTLCRFLFVCANYVQSYPKKVHKHSYKKSCRQYSDFGSCSLFFQKGPPWGEPFESLFCRLGPGARFSKISTLWGRPWVALGALLAAFGEPFGLHGRPLVPLGAPQGRPGDAPGRPWSPSGVIWDNLWALQGLNNVDKNPTRFPKVPIGRKFVSN